MKKIIFVLLTFVVSGCVSQQNSVYTTAQLDSLAQCMTRNGVVMYGSIQCSVCSSQKELFGSSFNYATYVECHPSGLNSQTQLCLSRGIERTPTWTMESNENVIKTAVGYQTIEELSEFSGCSLGVVS